MTTYGIELEFCASVSLRSLVSMLQKQNIDIYYVDPKQPTALYWKAEKDYSVLCNGKNRFGSSLKSIEKVGNTIQKMYAMEIVSPVLRNYNSLVTFLKSMHSLNVSYNINQTQGFHIHMSNRYLQLPEFKDVSFGTQWVTAFCINWVVFENLILSMHHPYRKLSPHARMLKDNLLYLDNQKVFDNLDVNKVDYSFDYINKLFNPVRKNYGSGKVYPKGKYFEVDLSHGRNSVVNLANLRINKPGRKGTIEIRSHEGTVDPKKIVSFVKMMRQFFRKCYDKNSKSFIDARTLVKKHTGQSYKKCSNESLYKVLQMYISN